MSEDDETSGPRVQKGLNGVLLLERDESSFLLLMVKTSKQSGNN